MLYFILLATSLTSIHAQQALLSCESKFPAPTEYNCMMACLDGILIECRQSDDLGAKSYATVDLALAENIHSSQLITSNDKFVKLYQIAHGGLELDTEIQALAHAEYADDAKEAPLFHVLSKPEPEIVIKKGAKGNFVFPLTFENDCKLVQGLTGALSQAQGMMLNGYIAMMNKCEVSASLSFGHEQFTGKFLINALERESLKGLKKGETPRGFFIGKMTEGQLLLDPRVYLDSFSQPQEPSTAKVAVPVSSYKHTAIQRRLTFTVKDPTQVLYFPTIKSGYNDIASVEFKLKDPSADVQSPQGPVFTFKTPKTLVHSPGIKLTSKRFELLGDLLDSPTLYLSQAESFTAPHFRFMRMGDISEILDRSYTEAESKLKNRIFLTKNSLTVHSELFAVQIEARKHTTDIFVKNPNAKAFRIERGDFAASASCIEGEILGFAVDKKKIKRISLPKGNALGLRTLTAKHATGKTATFCQKKGSAFEITKIQ